MRILDFRRAGRKMFSFVDTRLFVLLSLVLLPSLGAIGAEPADAASASPTPLAAPAGSPAVVAATTLIKLLPEAPTGWKADKPEGLSSYAAAYPITTVSRVYVKGDADDAPTATVHIIDSANNQQFQEATRAMWGITSESPSGYDKKVTVAGMPGFEHFASADQTGVLWAVVANRYFVQVETTKQLPAELEAWLSRIDLKALAALK